MRAPRSHRAVPAGATALCDVDRLVPDGRLALMTVSEACATAPFAEALTSLAADPSRRAGLLRWERLADRTWSTAPE